MKRVQVTHIEYRAPTPSNPTGEHITHPWVWELVDADGDMRHFDRKKDALTWTEEQN